MKIQFQPIGLTVKVDGIEVGSIACETWSELGGYKTAYVIRDSVYGNELAHAPNMDLAQRLSRQLVRDREFTMLRKDEAEA